MVRMKRIADDSGSTSTDRGPGTMIGISQAYSAADLNRSTQARARSVSGMLCQPRQDRSVGIVGTTRASCRRRSACDSCQTCFA